MLKLRRGERLALRPGRITFQGKRHLYPMNRKAAEPQELVRTFRNRIYILTCAGFPRMPSPKSCGLTYLRSGEEWPQNLTELIRRKSWTGQVRDTRTLRNSARILASTLWKIKIRMKAPVS